MMSDTPNISISTAELKQLAQSVGQTFIQRWDLHAVQWADGSWRKVDRPLTHSLLVAHLQGRVTLGAYVLDRESHGRYLVLDADDEPDRRRLIGLSQVLADQGAPTYFEHSRRGAHLWFFFERPLSGHTIRQFGQGLIHHFQLPDIELFPKQGQLGEGPGSLIRLPFGIHRKAGRRYGFWTVDGTPLAPSLREQIRHLATQQPIPPLLIDQFAARAPAPAATPSPKPDFVPRSPADLPEDAPLTERIKAAVSARDFIEPYVTLSRSGKGICPFHDDHIPSFYVNSERNFWYCFACDEGGSIIDFWMKYRNLDFSDALKELADRLLAQ